MSNIYLFFFRASSNLPGGGLSKHGGPFSNGFPKSNKFSGSKRENNNLFENHRNHRKVLKSRSHSHNKNTPSKNVWRESDLDPASLQNEIDVRQIQGTAVQVNGKRCLHKSKSDFGGNFSEGSLALRQVVPLENILTLSNNLLANNNSAVAAKSNTNNVPRISSKHPLKKSNTFPYEKLHHNDTTDSYSSENESMGCEKIQEENNVDSMADDQVNGQKETHNQN